MTFLPLGEEALMEGALGYSAGLRRHAVSRCPSTMLRMAPFPLSRRNQAARTISTGIDLYAGVPLTGSKSSSGTRQLASG